MSISINLLNVATSSFNKSVSLEVVGITIMDQG